MNIALGAWAAGLLLVAGAAVPASAATPEGMPSSMLGGSVSANAEVSAGEPIEVAFGRIVRIGPRNPLASWRCAVTDGGVRYYSIGVTEGGTRARLYGVSPKYAYCRRDRDNSFL